MGVICNIVFNFFPDLTEEAQILGPWQPTESFFK